jgi:integrase
MEICLAWERAARLAKEGSFTEDASRRILSQIGEMVGVEAAHTVTAGEFLREWAESKAVTKAPGTAKRYGKIIEDFLAFIGEARAKKNLAGLTAADVSRFRDKQIAEGLTPASANLAVKTLRIPLNVARRRGLILTNPAEAVEMLPAAAGERKTFTREQIAALIGAADEEWRGMILLGVCHGLRLGDASRLTWANIDAARQSLILFPQKTSRGPKRRAEEYPMHPDIAAYVESLPAGDDPKAPLFPRLCGREIGGAHGLSREFRKLMHRAGIYAEGEGEKKKGGRGRRFMELSFHSLRHTAISEQANQGIAREVRMKLSGHKSAVHDRYTHHELETLRREVERVPSFLSQNAAGGDPAPSKETKSAGGRLPKPPKARLPIVRVP